MTCSSILTARFPSNLAAISFFKALAMWTSLWTIQTLLGALDFCQAKTITKAWVFCLLLIFSLSTGIFNFVYLCNQIFHWQCYKPMKLSHLMSLNWLWHVFNQPLVSFVFLHRALWELCSHPQIKHFLAPKLWSLCSERIASCLWLYIYQVLDAWRKFGEHLRS